MGVYAFYGCTGLSYFTLGNCLKIIGDFAFANCITLTGVSLDLYINLTDISDYAFANCQSLQHFTVTPNVTTIGDNAFEDCYSMESINLADGASNMRDRVNIFKLF